MSKDIKITDIDCPACHIALAQLTAQKKGGGEFNILYCTSCKTVYDVKLLHEKWEYVPTPFDIPSSEN